MAETIRVLIADDEGTAIEHYRGLLTLDREQRYEIEHVVDSKEVLPAIQRFNPHVVLLDDQFREGKVGIDDILPKIRGRFPNVMVIIITAHRGRETEPIMRAMGWQAENFLDKAGLNHQELRKAVKKAYDAYLVNKSERY